MTLCKHNCGTIVDPGLGSCEMCCPEAVAAREKRIAPIRAAELKAIAKRGADDLAALEAKRAGAAAAKPKKGE